MGVEARSVAPLPGAPKRKLRNYLLDRRFQLKYTSMVVAVTMVVASILGTLAYQESKGQTEALQIQLATQPAAIRTRVLRLYAADVGANARSQRHVAARDALVTDWHGQGAVGLPGGVLVGRTGNLLAPTVR